MAGAAEPTFPVGTIKHQEREKDPVDTEIDFPRPLSWREESRHYNEINLTMEPMAKKISLHQFLSGFPAGTPILVSACLLGLNCRYNAQPQDHPELLKKLEHYHVLPICPEQLGGLPTPRPPAQIVNGSGIDVQEGRASIKTVNAGIDITKAFIRGAAETARICELFHVKAAILQQRSPSCGAGVIYRGDNLISGDGVTAALLRQMGILLFAID